MAFLRGSDVIVHAGDIGNASVLTELAAIAPVTAVRGNNDKGPWAETVRETEVLQVGQVFIYVVHDIAELDRDPVAAGFQVVVSGHSHKPSVKEREGVLYVNPGSSGPRRFKLPVAVAELLVNGNSVRARVVELDVDRQPPLERRRLTTRRRSRRG
jgi:putative phosphoesterase